MSAEAHGHDHGHDHEHEHHHKDTFITKYIFSIDHKMIAKQYLITGIIMGIIGIVMSLLFRMQLAWPEFYESNELAELAHNFDLHLPALSIRKQNNH